MWLDLGELFISSQGFQQHAYIEQYMVSYPQKALALHFSFRNELIYVLMNKAGTLDTRLFQHLFTSTFLAITDKLGDVANTKLYEQTRTHNTPPRMGCITFGCTCSW